MGSTDRKAEETALRFGSVVVDLALKVGYDLRPGGGGRAAFAEATGMSISAVGRMANGKTLPLPHHFESIAETVNVDVNVLLVAGSVISVRTPPTQAYADVASPPRMSTPPSPEDVADMWGLVEPGIREMFVGSAQQAIRLQHAADTRSREQGTAPRKR